MLFHKKTKTVLKWVWMVLGVFIIVSMILLYTPVFRQSGAGSSRQQAPQAPFSEN